MFCALLELKVGVSSVKINFLNFLSFIFSTLENETALILRAVISQEKVFDVENSEYTALAIQTTLKGLEVPLFWKKRELDIDHRLNAILRVLFYGIVKK